jgi:hypothetical protein
VGHVGFGDRADDHRLLEEPSKDEPPAPGAAPVEAEGELVHSFEVRIEVPEQRQCAMWRSMWRT